ncbi:hypothetical protein ACHAPI_012282 [Fusarium lateritium]
MDKLWTIVARITVNTEDLLWGQLMFKEGNDKRFVIPLAGIEDDLTKYLKLVKKFEEFLLLLAYITGGQPSRGEEIIGLRLINGINRDRNIFIIDGEVILITQYHKSLAHFNSPKVIPRFLPRQIGQLFVMYMIYIWLLTDRWEANK